MTITRVSRIEIGSGSCAMTTEYGDGRAVCTRAQLSGSLLVSTVG